ncbi:uncharacterized protein LOC129608438 [Condylostylus longicornis]|uniref:uncharacterized protein LOC129608438 n=1 Tax=Condylostylus longicornis TaxID=2530218 RepID=UPI00244E53A6|nr:uncharacterized protein LOC129608438 [Condylostylus longicornis]
MKVFISLLGFLTIIAIAQTNNLVGHKVYRVHFIENIQLRDLRDAMITRFEKVLWLYVDPNETWAEIVVSPKDEKPFFDLLRELSIQWEFLYEIQNDETLKNYMPRAVIENQRKSYRGYKVYKVTFDNEEQFEILRKMQFESGAGDFTFWHLSHFDKFADIMLAPTKAADFLNFLTKYNFKYECIVEDVEGTIPKTARNLNEKPKSYKGYKIYEVQFTTDEQFKILNQMLLESGETSDYNVLHLSRSRKIADIMVGPSKISNLFNVLDQENLSYKCVCEDVEELINESKGKPTNDRSFYKGYKVYRVNFNSDEQFETLRKMQIESGSGNYSFWQLRQKSKLADIMVSPENATNLLSILEKNNMSYEVIIDDVEEYIKTHN